MKLNKALIFLGLSILLSVSVQAQTTKKEVLPESDTKPNVNYNKAQELFEKAEYYNAVPFYKKAYTKENDRMLKTGILYSIAQCYRLMNDVNTAIEWYQKAIKEGSDKPQAYFYLAECERAIAKYDEALGHYRTYQQSVPDDQLAAVGIQSCTSAKEWITNPTKYKVENVEAINSKYSDFNVALSRRNSRILVFTSSREEAMGNEDDGWTGEKRTDLFETFRDDKGKWTTPKPMGPPINTELSEGSAFFDRKGGNMFFTRCDKSTKKEGTCNIFFAKRKGDMWDTPKAISLFGDSITVGHPCLSRDELSLYFSSDMPGGFGGKDIYVSVYNPDKKTWGRPINLGPKVNTPGDEMFPFIHTDGTLYFSSNGHIGMGGLDIFKAKFKGEKTAAAFLNGIANDDTLSYGDITLTKFELESSKPVEPVTQGVDSLVYFAQAWEEAENMKYPINSSYDDFAIIFETGPSEFGYLSSNREGGKGSDDIYGFRLPPLEFTIQGKVMDLDNRGGVKNATVELLGNDGSIVSVKTDKKGAFIFDKSMVKPNTVYKVTASSKNYLSAKGVQSTVGLVESTNLFVDAFLLKSTLKPINLTNIYYDLNKATLREDSKIALDSLVTTLLDNPKLVIRVMSHTDSRASDEYNLKLSQDRAQSVVDYLISKGIEPERLEAKGYGESKPLITDAEIEKIKDPAKKEEAFQKNRRTEFEQLRDDFVPKPHLDQPEGILDTTGRSYKVGRPMVSDKESSKEGVQKTVPTSTDSQGAMNKKAGSKSATANKESDDVQRLKSKTNPAQTKQPVKTTPEPKKDPQTSSVPER